MLKTKNLKYNKIRKHCKLVIQGTYKISWSQTNYSDPQKVGGHCNRDKINFKS